RVHLAKSMEEFEFCRKNFLSPRNLAAIEDLKQQLFVSLVESGFLPLNEKERLSLNDARFSSYHRRHFFIVPEHLDFNSRNDAMINSVIAAAFYPKLL